MATDIEYALMAGVSYRSTRGTKNQFPVPEGWTTFNYESNGISGFEAISFTNGSEIVISFAGTYNKSAGDLAADAGLAIGLGSPQLLEAAKCYLQVKAANPNAEITLTGHSLGGGLASLLAVFFNEEAVTFD
jgi:putative lipase involved disintegration of autophagic bodies